MNFKEFIRSLLKKLICIHDWETRTNYLEIEDFYTHKKTIVSETSTVCKKCGKFKKVKSY